jgi:hypothetical protein
MLTLTSILAMVTGAIHYAWVLILLLIPSVLNVVSPIIEAITKAISSFTASVWEGLTNSTWATWCLILLVSGIAFGIGYHTGWDACIEWVHAHYRLITKLSPTAWWKVW